MNFDYDVVVIGAGIHGAGVAQAAAAAGYSVLVLEQYNEAARATSSKSSKLIHGGLRYLETFQFKLVYECIKERERLLEIAPHIVRLVPFYIPVYSSTSRRPWLVMLGLLIYSLMSGRLFKWLSRNNWEKLDGLKKDGLEAVFSYYDAQTDDARLTRSVLASAIELGACIEFCSHFDTAYLLKDGCDVKYTRRDLQETATKTVKTRVVINATNAWTNIVNRCIEPPVATMDIELVQGTHIIVPGSSTLYYYLESPSDKRAVFVVPWKGHLLIGTTEHVYTDDPAEVQPLTVEVDYLLDIYNYYFSTNLKREEIIDVYSGLRVLPSNGKTAFGRSRDTGIYYDREKSPRVVTIYGGKLTSYRITAEKIMNKLLKSLPVSEMKANTRTLKLPIVD